MPPQTAGQQLQGARRHELEKRRAYKRRILEEEHGSFTPLVLSTVEAGVLQPHTRLATLISAKLSQPYSTTMSFICAKLPSL